MRIKKCAQNQTISILPTVSWKMIEDICLLHLLIKNVFPKVFNKKTRPGLQYVNNVCLF